MKNAFITILIFFLFQGFVLGQKEGLATIKKEDLKANMEFLASDFLMGRETGTEANDVAGLYIKSIIKRFGLKPGGDDYYQHMLLASYRNKMEESYLKISDYNGKELFSTDSLMLLMTGHRTMDAAGKIVFAGYGYEDEKSGYNDFDGIDVKDKIVLFMTRTPEMVRKGEGESSLNFQSEEGKIGSLFERGAKALLMVFDPSYSEQDPFMSMLYEVTRSGQVYPEEDTLRSIPFILAFIKPGAANQLLSSSGKTLQQYQHEIYASGKPVSVEIPGINVSLKAAVEKRKFDSKNVIGIVEGSDPVLKNECIVYTAHFDHAGTDSNGEVYNGADDDASGSVGLIELAEAFMKLEKKPLRSVVFAWVNGEEKGLLGSEYYVNNPAITLDRTLLDINLDMIGRTRTPADTGRFFGIELDVIGPDEVILYTKHESSDVTRMISSAAAKNGLKIIDKGEDIEAGGSDHESFWNKGVPAVMFHTGVNADTHRITDEESRIDYDKMEQITKLVFQLGYDVANKRERIRIDNSINK
ncbi:MAG TPA: M20/M25/M40 family metallo-hydrolase [Bacteroidales bacterium]|nr:M20/M25/M40 family metallo-hydrolase [Bacteroidales bacterium]